MNRQDNGLTPRRGFPALSERSPRVPSVHVPYLVATGVFGLGLAAALAGADGLGLPEALWWWLCLCIAFAALGLHVVWFWTLFRDAEVVLGKRLPLTRYQVVSLTLLGCMVLPLVPLWGALSIVVLLRTAHSVATEVDEVESAEIRRVGLDAPGLLVAALLVGVILFVHLMQWAEEAGRNADSGALVALPELLGPSWSILTGLFYLTAVGYYVHFLSRAIPALYRSYGLILSAHRGND